MRQLSPAGQRAVNDLSQKHGFSADAVASMLDAVWNGNGGMAQFNHPEFGGSGQWMRGGMTMIGDMFNTGLKGRVEALCADLAALFAERPGLVLGGSFQSQTQGGQRQGGFSGVRGEGGDGPVSLFVPEQNGSGRWWPDDLGWPDSSGAQNHVRYAYFAQARRLAIEMNGVLTVHDTLDHRIGGVSQQQSQSGSLSFTSQHGLVDVATLPAVPVQATPSSLPAEVPVREKPRGTSRGTSGAMSASGADSGILGMIEKLADLHGKGILSEAEFAAKKAELLARL